MLDPIAMQEAMEAITSGEAVIVDVRSGEEWDESHASGAVHIDIDDLENGMRPEVAKETNIYLYSQKGMRSERAKEILLDDGYTNVMNLGGLTDWVALGGPVE